MCMLGVCLCSYAQNLFFFFFLKRTGAHSYLQTLKVLWHQLKNHWKQSACVYKSISPMYKLLHFSSVNEPSFHGLWRETTEQIDWWAKQPSEDMKCWEAWDTTCRHKAKDITPLTAWRREALKEEVLDNLPWTNERGPLSIRWTLQPRSI